MTPDLAQVSAGILAFFTELSEAEQRISFSLYRLLAQGDAVPADALARAAGVLVEEVERTLTRWPGVFRNSDGRFIGYWGLTTTRTRHRMQLGNRLLHAWCAWDTLFLPELLAETARVESSCAVTGEPIALEVGPRGVEAGNKRPPASFIVPDPQKAKQDVVSNFCHFVHFFSTEKAGAEWVSQHPGTIPREALSPVYVFKNGVPGEGPFKFQPDVFDNPPGSSGYTPLRELNLVTWKDAGKARELKSADEVRKAVERAEIVIERPGVVINMPLLTWPGGQR